MFRREALVILAEGAPQLAADGDAAAAARVAGFDLHGHDADLADEAAGADATGQRVLIEEAAHPSVHEEEDERPTEDERRPLHLDGNVVEGEDGGDEGRHGERQEDERAADERELDEGEHDRQAEPDPRPNVEVDAEVEDPVGQHELNITAGGQA